MPQNIQHIPGLEEYQTEYQTSDVNSNFQVASEYTESQNLMLTLDSNDEIDYTLESLDELFSDQNLNNSGFLENHFKEEEDLDTELISRSERIKDLEPLEEESLSDFSDDFEDSENEEIFNPELKKLFDSPVINSHAKK